MNKYMRIGDLKKVIAELPDNMVILQEGGDHEMFPVWMAVGPVFACAPVRNTVLEYAPFNDAGETNHRALLVTR